jgi:hypothetical protein
MAASGPQTLELKSFPGSWLTLPAGSQVLIPEAIEAPALVRAELMAAIQERVCASWRSPGASPQQKPCRLLLLLPDKTRRQTASRLALDALLDLCEQDPRFTLTLLFGLGTHPRMGEPDLEAILEPQRQRRLKRLAIPVLQQTTLSSLPCRTLAVRDPRSVDGKSLSLQVPEPLWCADLVLVAGDTDLHPYEGRAGSGGIHKMLAIGVGCMGTVRITHSLDVLTHPQTRPGANGNRFVELVDYFALEIISALRASGRLQADPIGISVVCRHQERVEAFWIGDKEAERAQLMRPLLQERTLQLRESVELVVADTEPGKGTDLLAGARSLHLLCNLNSADNPILCPAVPCRTALLFNPCNESRNAHGIGNAGTVLHLQALLQFSLECWRQKPKPEPQAEDNPQEGLAQRWQWSRRLKTTILERWERYLHLVSEEERVFGAIEQALDDADRSQTGNPKELQPLALLDQALPHSFGAHRHLFEGCRSRLLRSGPIEALAFLRNSSDQLGFKGLGEGGQRALRLLALLRSFDQLVVATANPVVLDFLQQFNPEQDRRYGNHEGPTAADTMLLHPFGLIGLQGLSLRERSPQRALERVIEEHEQISRALINAEASACATRRSLALVQQPVILQGRKDADAKAEATPGP